jgi:hypothetical protein
MNPGTRSGGLCAVGVLVAYAPLLAEDAREAPGGWELAGPPALGAGAPSRSDPPQLDPYRPASSQPDPRLSVLLEELEEAKVDGFARARGEFALPPARLPVRWVLDLSPPPAPPPPSERAGALAVDPESIEAGRTSFKPGALVVTIPARKYLAAPQAARRVIAHEAAHAAIASALGTPERYSLLPRWFREGVALGFAGEGDARLDDRIAWTVFVEEPADAFLCGLPPPGAGLPGAGEPSYAEAWLGVRRLEERVGPAGTRSLILAALRGDDFVHSLEDLLGVSFDTFRADALRHARRRVRELLPAAREEAFRESLRLRAVRPSEAVCAWRRLLEEDARCPLAGTLRYLLARALLRDVAAEGAPGEALPPLADPADPRLEAARRDLEALLAADRALWRAEALVLLGECHALRGASEAARGLWEEAIERFGEDDLPASRARRLLDRPGRPSRRSPGSPGSPGGFPPPAERVR